MSLFSQVPNASFENWEQESTWQVPTDWQTNNAEMGFVSVYKVQSLTVGDFAMRVVNRGHSFEGYDYGHAYCTFYPTGSYNQLELFYKIDSISGGANIEILISQYDGIQFKQIGSWQTENITNGIEKLNIPFSQLNNDSTRIEIWSNSLLKPTGQEGYAEIIVDRMDLSLTSSSTNFSLNDQWIYEQENNIGGGNAQVGYTAFSIQNKVLNGTFTKYVIGDLDTFYVNDHKMYFWDNYYQEYIMYYDWDETQSYEIKYYDRGRASEEVATVIIDSISYQSFGVDSLQV